MCVGGDGVCTCDLEDWASPTTEDRGGDRTTSALLGSQGQVQACT